MNRHGAPTDPAPARTRRKARRQDRSPLAAGVSALEALSAATNRYARSVVGKRPPHRKVSLALAVIAASAVGIALTLAGRFEYRCVATMRIAGDPSSSQCAVHRKELLDYTWGHMGETTSTDTASERWFVNSPAEDLLQVGLATPDREAGLARVQAIARGFCDKMRAVAAAARSTPSQAENILTEHVVRLRTRLNDAQGHVDAAIAALPETDPSEHRAALLSRWVTLRSDFDTARGQLAEVSANVAQLQSEPEPTYGLVSGEERREALQANDVLQQDIRELAVNLSELKLHLLNVWQRSAGALEQLALAADELIEIASSNPGQPTPQVKRRGDLALAVTVQAYTDMVETFAETWTHEFMALQRLEVNPYSGEVLDVYQRLRRQLNDFLFDAAKRLASMRSQVRALSADQRDSARHHVFQSNLVRAFQTMQALHHRFEFAAGTIETPDNFRLDAALKAARGLRRRSQSQIRAIEEALQAKATKRARKRRIKELARAEQLVAQVRTAADQTIDELIALQEELNLGAESSEAFLRAALKAEIATTRLRLTRTDLTQTEGQLSQLAADRVSKAEAADIELVSAGVIGRPVNLTERLGTGTLAATLTLAMILLAQWWITRRP